MGTNHLKVIQKKKKILTKAFVFLEGMSKFYKNLV